MATQAQPLSGQRAGTGRGAGIAGLFASILERARSGLAPAASQVGAATAGAAPPSGKEATGAELALEKKLSLHARTGAGTGAAAGTGVLDARVPAASSTGTGAEALLAASAGRKSGSTAPQGPARASPHDIAAGVDGGEGTKSEAKRRAAERRPAETVDPANASLIARAGQNAEPRLAQAAFREARTEDRALPSEREGSRSAKDAAPVLTVSDLRRQAAKRKEGGGGEPLTLEAAARAEQARADSAPARELVLDLGRPGATSADPGSSATDSTAPGILAKDFSAVLAENLREAWNGEIVKSAHIVLRDGDSGTIRLRLRPESLGSVKIELNLADNSISGKIVVESDEAKNAFERNMAGLHDAFRDGGFESSSLEVSVGQGGDGGTEDGAAGNDTAGGPWWSERRRVEAFDAAPPSAEAPRTATGNAPAVDILA